MFFLRDRRLTSRVFKLFSPAKINLYLHVKGRRPDGFHNLETVMQAIDLGDILTFKFAKEDRLTSDSMICDASNLINKALQLFHEKTKIAAHYHIHLEKKIPIGGGLGGGSSNVATTLYGLNKLHNFPISEKTLQRWSAEISSDAPFFFSKGSALCTSKGEEVQEIKLPLSKVLYLICPPYGVSTKEVFRLFQLKKRHHPNDLEEEAFQVEPRLKKLKEGLLQNYRMVMMTGSGSSFICSEPKNKADGRPIHFVYRDATSWYESL